MEVIEQQPYNLFAQQKRAGYPSSAQTPADSQPVEAVATPQSAAQPQVQAQPVVQQKPVAKAAGTVALQPGSSTAGMDYLNSLYTDPKEEERLRKASVMNQRILAIGDAVRHIGNIANTVNYAPAQQFNDPVAMEEARYEKGKTMRDKANQLYYTYQQQKAAQDAAQRKWEQQYGLQQVNVASQHAYRQEQARIAAERSANQKAYQEGTLGLNKQKAADQKAYNEARLKQQTSYQNRMAGIAAGRLADQQRRTTAYVNRQSGGSGSGVAPLDTPKGQITPNGRSYSNQLLQMFDYAKSKGYVQETDVARRLRELGFGKDQSDNVKRQMVMDLLRTNQDMGDYASSRLGWSYGAGGGGMDLGLEDDEDEMDLGLD
jgi:hypothetical protein